MNRAEKTGNIFEWFLVITVIAALIMGGYESYVQQSLPAYSILGFVRSLGYLEEYPLVYAPGKGIWHTIGWAGSGMMVIMMFYSIRKRFAVLRDFGSLRHWLSAHMFLGILGPVLVTYHTTFKFGGIIAASFWCMVVTMIFGILGRYIYVQIPRSLAGAELEAGDIERMITEIDAGLAKFMTGINIAGLSRIITSSGDSPYEGAALKAFFTILKTDISNLFRIRQLNKILKGQYKLAWNTRRRVISLLRKKAALIRKRNFLHISHKLLNYWHVLHVPLAIVMFLIMIIHIIVYYLFRPVY